MIRRIFALLLCLMLLIPAVQAEDFDVELEITEILENLPEEQGSKILKDSDGAVIMTITCTGDFTIGGDTFHNKDIFTPELNAHDGNINFTMSGVRDILTGDDLTIVNFEGTFTDTTYVPSNK